MRSEDRRGPVEGAIVAPLDVEEAQELTREIRRGIENVRAAVGRLAARVQRAHAARVWTVLGYSSWAQYAAAEFGVSRSHAYRLLDLARAADEITGAVAALGVLAPASHAGDIPLELPVRAVVALKGRMGEVCELLAERLRDAAGPGGGGLSPGEVGAVVAAVVTEVRSRPDVPRVELDPIEIPAGVPYTVEDVREGRAATAQTLADDRRLGEIALEIAPAFWSEDQAAEPLGLYAAEIGGEDIRLLLACRRYIITGDYRAVDDYRRRAHEEFALLWDAAAE